MEITEDREEDLDLHDLLQMQTFLNTEDVQSSGP